MTQNKNDSINPILQHGRGSIPYSRITQGFPYLILCPRQCKSKVAITYLAIRTKNN